MGIEVKIPEIAFVKHCFVLEDKRKVEYKPLPALSLPSGVEVVYLFGYSPFIAPLLQWAAEKPERELVILENRRSVLEELEEEGLSAPFLAENIHFRLWLPEVSVEDFAASLVRDFPLGRAYLLDLQGDAELFAQIEGQILRKATLSEAVYTEMLHYHKLFANIIANVRRLPEAFDLGSWKDAFKGVPCVVCGAGPSLQEAAALLQREKELLIFAGGSAIPAVRALQSTPHLQFAVDPNPGEYTRLATHTSGDPLVIAPRLERRVVADHRGPIGFFPTGTGGAIEDFLVQRLDIKDVKILENLSEEALSVTSIALMTALHLGCNPIVLAGVDLSFTSGKRYAAGVDGEEEIAEPVVEHAGKATLTKWIMEQATIEEVVRCYPERTFYRASREGLPLQGVPFLEDPALLTRASEDLRGRIHNKILASKMTITRAEVDALLLELQGSFQKALELLQQLQREPALAPLLMMDLEETLAYKLALKSSSFALSYCIDKKQRLQGTQAAEELYKNLEEVVQGFNQCFG